MEERSGGRWEVGKAVSIRMEGRVRGKRGGGGGRDVHPLILFMKRPRNLQNIRILPSTNTINPSLSHSPAPLVRATRVLGTQYSYSPIFLLNPILPSPITTNDNPFMTPHMRFRHQCPTLPLD